MFLNVPPTCLAVGFRVFYADLSAFHNHRKKEGETYGLYLKLDLVSSNLYPFVMLRTSVISAARSQAWASIRARPVRGNGVMDSTSKKTRLQRCCRADLNVLIN